MTKTITVGFDASPESRDAVEWAANEAVERNCQLKVVTCCRPPPASEVYAGWNPTEAYGNQMESANAEIHDVSRAVHAAHPDLDICTEVCSGSAGEVLVADTSDEVDLIVLGASSHKGSSAFWLGSTPRTVVHRARCPVVVVRGSMGRDRPTRVVVGTDGSENATDAVRWAAAEADLHGITLLVVHGWNHPYDMSAVSGPSIRDMIELDARLVLDAGVDMARTLCAADVTGELIEDTPSAALLGIVRDGDLLVLGTRGRGVLSARLFGSTVNSVLDRVHVPVAVIRTADDT